jgi:hypothetical protein
MSKGVFSITGDGRKADRTARMVKSAPVFSVHVRKGIPMKMKLLSALALAIVLAVSTAGCVVALGNRTPETKATLGKQLTDLKQARDNGAISEDEYQAARKRLLEGK